MTKLFALCAALLLSHAAAHAQKATPAKIGHLSGTVLVGALPETKLAEIELAAYIKTWQSQYDELNARYTTLAKDFQLHAKTLADTARAARSARGEALQQQLQSIQTQAQVGIDKKRQALYEPINAKVNRAIEAIAVAKGYDYVLDDKSGQVLYIKKIANDLLPAVKVQLGIKE